MKYKAVVTDLDGTLLNPQGRLSSDTLTTLQKLNTLGVSLILATGRHPKDAQNIFRSLDLQTLIVGLNGALTLCNNSGEILHERVISPECIAGILWLTADQKIHISAFDSQGWKLSEVNKMSVEYAKFSNFPYMTMRPSEIFELKINKLLLWCDGGIAPVEQVITQHFGKRLECYRISAQQLEIGPPGISKATTVTELLASRCISFQHEAIAFGDGENDIDMLRQAAQGVVMGNASHEIKSMLHQLPVAPSNASDGVAHILQQVFHL